MHHNVSNLVRTFVHFSVHSMAINHRQENTITMHPFHRFYIVSIGLLEVSTADGGAPSVKSAVMGDLFTGYVEAVSILGESAATLELVVMD